MKPTQKQPYAFELQKKVWPSLAALHTQDGQGEKVVKSRWWPRNGCDGPPMGKNLMTIQVNFVLIPSEGHKETRIVVIKIFC